MCSWSLWAHCANKEGAVANLKVLLLSLLLLLLLLLVLLLLVLLLLLLLLLLLVLLLLVLVLLLLLLLVLVLRLPGVVLLRQLLHELQDLPHQLLGDHLDDLVLLELLAGDVQGEIVGVHNATDEVQVPREEVLELV